MKIWGQTYKHQGFQICKKNNRDTIDISHKSKFLYLLNGGVIYITSVDVAVGTTVFLCLCSRMILFCGGCLPVMASVAWVGSMACVTCFPLTFTYELGSLCSPLFGCLHRNTTERGLEMFVAFFNSPHPPLPFNTLDELSHFYYFFHSVVSYFDFPSPPLRSFIYCLPFVHTHFTNPSPFPNKTPT